MQAIVCQEARFDHGREQMKVLAGLDLKLFVHLNFAWGICFLRFFPHTGFLAKSSDSVEFFVEIYWLSV